MSGVQFSSSVQECDPSVCVCRCVSACVCLRGGEAGRQEGRKEEGGSVRGKWIEAGVFSQHLELERGATLVEKYLQPEKKKSEDEEEEEEKRGAKTGSGVFLT